MFTKNKTKFAIILVALCLCLTVVLGACNNAKAFTPVKTVAGEVSGNGGIAVRYGDYIFYVNGYQSDATSANDYTDSKRVGSIVRISVEDLEAAIEKTTQKNKTSSVISSEISKLVAEKAVVVVPNFYYSNNTTETGLNGIYIFGGRLYYTTPNDDLTADGSKLTSELVLKSINLADPEKTATRHFVFTDNSAQILLTEQSNKVVATYIMGSKLYNLDVADGKSTEIKSHEVDEETKENKDLTVSNVKYDKNGDGQYTGLFFTDGDGSICHIAAGASDYQVYVTNPKSEDDSKTSSLTIKSVNDGYVYYTKTPADGSDYNVYLANGVVEQGKDKIFCTGGSSLTLYGYGDKVIFVPSAVTDAEQSYYNIVVKDKDGNKDNDKPLLVPANNVYSITVNRIEGKYLYYTANSVNYKLDIDAALVTAQETGTVIGKSLSTTATGWSTPDVLNFTIGEVVHSYVFTLASGSVSVVKFDAAKQTNSTSATITLAEQSKD